VLLSYITLKFIGILLVVAFIGFSVWDWFYSETETASAFDDRGDFAARVTLRSYFIVVALIILILSFLWLASQF
jgi:hypothetical protein